MHQFPKSCNLLTNASILNLPPCFYQFCSIVFISILVITACCLEACILQVLTSHSLGFRTQNSHLLDGSHSQHRQMHFYSTVLTRVESRSYSWSIIDMALKSHWKQIYTVSEGYLISLSDMPSSKKRSTASDYPDFPSGIFTNLCPKSSLSRHAQEETFRPVTFLCQNLQGFSTSGRRKTTPNANTVPCDRILKCSPYPSLQNIQLILRPNLNTGVASVCLEST